MELGSSDLAEGSVLNCWVLNLDGCLLCVYIKEQKFKVQRTNSCFRRV